MSRSKMLSREYEPLTPAVFYILLALSFKERHGYEIMKNVAESSKGKINLGPGTLYGTIKRLLEEGLIKETKGDERRRYYKITDLGRRLLNIELERFEEALKVFKKAKFNLGFELSVI